MSELRSGRTPVLPAEHPYQTYGGRIAQEYFGLVEPFDPARHPGRTREQTTRDVRRYFANVVVQALESRDHTQVTQAVTAIIDLAIDGLPKGSAGKTPSSPQPARSRRGRV